MKWIKQFEKYKAEKGLNEIIKEAVMQVDDVSKVRAVADIPQSLINSVVKKCKDASGKNIRQFYSDNDIAEEIVKHVFSQYINIDHISTVPFVGGEAQAQKTQAQPQVQPQTQPQAQAQPQAQPPQVEAQPQPQAQSETQPQAQEVPQEQPQTQAQIQVQAEAQPQGESEEDFEEVQDNEEEESELPEEGNEDLPL